MLLSDNRIMWGLDRRGLLPLAPIVWVAVAACGGDGRAVCGRAVLIAAGETNSAVVRDDGRVFGWGDGNGSPTAWPPLQSAPAQLILRAGLRCARGVDNQITCDSAESWSEPKGLAIAAGMRGTFEDIPFIARCLLDLDHHATCRWTEDSTFGPVADGVDHIAVGADHVCVSTPGVGLSCVGRSEQPGDLAQQRWAQSFDIIGTDIVDVASNAENACALTAAGALWCWGLNHYGEAGTPNQNEIVPVQVAGLGAPVMAVSMGGRHTCAVTSDRALWCWGSNILGALGNGRAEFIDANLLPQVHAPARVPGFDHGVIAVAAGSYHTCAIDCAGQVWCWGRNDVGQLGDGTIKPTTDGFLGMYGYAGVSPSPVQVVHCD